MANVFTQTEGQFFSTEGLESYSIAAWWQRLGTLLIDIFGIYTFAFVVAIVLSVSGLIDLVVTANELVLSWTITFIYYFVQEAIWCRTLGKLIMRTRAVRADGGALEIRDATIRTICRFIPFEAFSFLGHKGRPIGWHDRVSRTLVISAKKADAGTV